MSASMMKPLTEAETAAALVPGRECGTCTLCCKVMRVDELESPAGQWCKHCSPGKGCGIHATRPPVCREFFCIWMYKKEIGPEWKPEKSKIILTLEGDGARIAAHVDPSFPGAWRRSPFYEDLKRWSEVAASRQQQVSVWIGRHAIVILPDRDVDLGIVAEDELVVSTVTMTPQGPVLGAEKIHRDAVAERERQWAAAKRRHGVAER
jgi:Fe-S-cluster containining protein